MKTKVVTDAELGDYVGAKTDLDRANEAQKLAQVAFDGIEALIVARMKIGKKKTIRSKHYTAVLTSELGQCRPPWKEELLDHIEKEHGIPKVVTEGVVRARHPAKMVDKLIVEVK